MELAIFDGRERVGTLPVRREGLYAVFRAELPLRDGLQRLWLCGETERVCLGILAAMLALRAQRGEDCGGFARGFLASFAAQAEYRDCAEKLMQAWDDGLRLDFYR